MKPGVRFGDLVTVAPAGGDIWICRCQCGREVKRSERSIRYAIWRGSRSACGSCRSAKRRASLERRSKNQRAMFLEWWEEYGSLWSPDEETRAKAEIREDVGSELGGWSESLARLPMIEEPDGGSQYDCTGTETPHDMTLAEVGRELGLSGERIRAIELGALAKMRRAMEKLVA